MKKIITFLFCITIISSAFAQNDIWNKKNRSGYNNDDNNIIWKRDQEIQKINYQTDCRVTR